MKHKLFIICTLSYILAIACSVKPEIPPPYDSRCNYVMNGTIFGNNSIALDNIKVKLYEVTPDLPPKTILRDSCISNDNGFYEVKNINVIPYISNTYELHLSDLYHRRPNHNHSYKDTVITVIFINENFINGDDENFLGEAFWELDITLNN